MFYFGPKSKKYLDTCDPDLKKLFNEVIKYYDCAVIEGHRGQEAQDEYEEKGLSYKRWPDSKHNSYPARAVHVVPWFKHSPHIRWKDTNKFYQFSGAVEVIASQLGIEIRWGGNWDRDDELDDQNFMDLAHWESL